RRSTSLSNPQLRRWLPVIIWASVIALFSTSIFSGERTSQMVLPVLAVLFPSASREELLEAHAVIRKLAHFLEYLILSVLLYRALRNGHRWDMRAAGMAIVLAGIYSMSDEFHQWFVPGRTAAASDCLIDVSGAAAGQGVVAAWRGRAAKRA